MIVMRDKNGKKIRVRDEKEYDEIMNPKPIEDKKSEKKDKKFKEENVEEIKEEDEDAKE